MGRVGGVGDGVEDGWPESYLSNATDVLIAILLGESQVLVQPEAHIVTVEPVGGEADMEQVLFKCSCDGRLARGREPGEPDGEASLSPQLVPLVPRERRVPGDVSAQRLSHSPRNYHKSTIFRGHISNRRGRGVERLDPGTRGTHVAIVLVKEWCFPWRSLNERVDCSWAWCGWEKRVETGGRRIDEGISSTDSRLVILGWPQNGERWGRGAGLRSQTPLLCRSPKIFGSWLRSGAGQRSSTQFKGTPRSPHGAWQMASFEPPLTRAGEASRGGMSTTAIFRPVHLAIERE